MILHAPTEQEKFIAKKLDFEPHTSTTVNIDGTIMLLEDLRLKSAQGHIKSNRERPTTIIARVPTLSIFGGLSNQKIASMQYSITRDNYMKISPSKGFIEPELFSAMLKYAETSAWSNDINGMVFSSDLNYLNSAVAKELYKLDYHTGTMLEDVFETEVQIIKHRVTPTLFKSDFVELYKQAGGRITKKIKNLSNEESSERS